MPFSSRLFMFHWNAIEFCQLARGFFIQSIVEGYSGHRFSGLVIKVMPKREESVFLNEGVSNSFG